VYFEHFLYTVEFGLETVSSYLLKYPIPYLGFAAKAIYVVAIAPHPVFWTGVSAYNTTSVSLPPPGRRKVLATPQAAFYSSDVL